MKLIVNLCCLNFPELPLGGNHDSKYDYFADTGMLVAIIDEEAQDDLRANQNCVYKGALYENIVSEASQRRVQHYKRGDLIA